MTVRNAQETEIEQLARIWHDGWREAHERILPAELARDRTLESLQARLREALPDVRATGAPGEPTGFCILKNDELYQLYVSPQARGKGAAAALLGDAEARLAERGILKAWLACAIGNDRAARFYEKSGWRRVGDMISVLQTAEGPFRLKVWRYEKALARRA